MIILRMKLQEEKEKKKKKLPSLAGDKSLDAASALRPTYRVANHIVSSSFPLPLQAVST